MTLRRLFVGTLVLFAISFWCWLRPCPQDAHAHPANHSLASAASNDGNQELQEQRFRTNQCRHWKQLMVGSR